MYDVKLEKGLKARHYLANAFFCGSFTKSLLPIKHRLQGTSICIFQDTIIVTSGANNFLLPDDVRTVDHA